MTGPDDEGHGRGRELHGDLPGAWSCHPRRAGLVGVLGILRVVLASARAVAKTRLQTSGVPFYLMVWLSFPIFNVLLIALIYRDNPTLRNYAIVAGAGLALLFGMVFNASEILDRERQTGTLGNLFVAPHRGSAGSAGSSCSRSRSRCDRPP